MPIIGITVKYRLSDASFSRLPWFKSTQQTSPANCDRAVGFLHRRIAERFFSFFPNSQQQQVRSFLHLFSKDTQNFSEAAFLPSFCSWFFSFHFFFFLEKGSIWHPPRRESTNDWPLWLVDILLSSSGAGYSVGDRWRWRRRGKKKKKKEEKNCLLLLFYFNFILFYFILFYFILFYFESGDRGW